MNKIKDTMVITLAALAFIVMTGVTKADEHTKDTVKPGDTDKLWAMVFSGNLTDDFDRIKAAINVNEPNNKVTTYLKNEWEETKSFQKKNWADGKSQWSRNKDQIKSLWIRISGTEKNND